MKIKNILLTLCTSLLLTNVAAHAKEVKIGMAIDDLRLERWQKDRDIFVKKAESLGAKVFGKVRISRSFLPKLTR